MFELRGIRDVEVDAELGWFSTEGGRTNGSALEVDGARSGGFPQAPLLRAGPAAAVWESAVARARGNLEMPWKAERCPTRSVEASELRRLIDRRLERLDFILMLSQTPRDFVLSCTS